MQETEFHPLAKLTLNAMFEALESADEAGELDVDYQEGVMTITLASKRQFVVSKHTPSRQLWLSSPISGGLHFGYDEAGKQWALADGRTLAGVLAAELKSLAGVEVTL